MSVKIISYYPHQEHVGKFALIKGDQVNLYTGIMSDKKGGWRGCGKQIVFPADGITITADDPAKELKQQDQFPISPILSGASSEQHFNGQAKACGPATAGDEKGAKISQLAFGQPA